MKNQPNLLTVVLLLILMNTTYAQNSNDSLTISFDPYASFRGYMAVTDNELDLSENISRVGAKFKVTKGKISFIAASELHLTLFKGGQSFSVDGNPSNEFLQIKTLDNTKTFTNRLGYMGVDFDKYGIITFGKQWSVYYDITSYTDNFYVFGGTASATYVGGTDGGASGTGRADQAIIYRNNIGKFYFGAQAQAKGKIKSKFVDGYGFSAQYKFNNELFIGAAMNRAYVDRHLITDHEIIGLKGEPTYYTVGAKYTGKRLNVSVVGSLQKNGDFTQGNYFNSENILVSPAVVFDAKGIELYSKYNFNKFSIHGGYLLYKPDTKIVIKENNQLLLNKHFEINNLLFGFAFHPTSFITIFNEQRLSFGKNALGIKDKNVYTLGMRLNFSKNFKTTTTLK